MINLYYDRVERKAGATLPVPNGIREYRLDPKVWSLPFASVRTMLGVKPISSFYYTLKRTECEVFVYTGKTLTKNLFYPLEMGNGININIPPTTLDFLKEGKLKLLILAQDFHGALELERVKFKIDCIVSEGINPKNVHVVTGDVNNTYKKFFQPYHTYGVDWWQVESRLILQGDYKKYNNFLKLDSDTLNTDEKFNYDIEHEKLFYSYSNYSNDYRLSLVASVIEKEIDPFGIINYIKPKHKINLKGDRNLVDLNLSSEKTSLKESIIKEVYNGFNISIKDNLEHHLNSYFTIITPKFSFESDKYIDESRAVFTTYEMWKMIFLQKPFIIVGNSGIIKYLQSIGYHTYHNVINERYDSFTSPVKKVNLITDELKRLSTADNLQELMKEVADYSKLNSAKFIGRSQMPTMYALFDQIRKNIKDV